MAQTYYDILEVSPAVSPQVIRAAYKSLMQQYHPDKAGNDPTMVERTIRIRGAFEVLSDPDKRLAYDQGLERDAQLRQPVRVAPELNKPSRPVAPNGRKQKDSDPLQDPNTRMRVIRFLLIWVGLAILIVLVGARVEKNEQKKAREVAEAMRAKVAALQAEEQSQLELRQAEAAREAEAVLARRTINRFATNLKASMLPSAGGQRFCYSFDPCPRYILIPSITLELRAPSADLVMMTLARNRELVLEALIKRLQNEQYTQLLGINADQRLASILADEVNKVLLSASYSSEAGVAKVLLPLSFSIK